MESLLPKSEFLKRLRQASRLYKDRFFLVRRTADDSVMHQIAAKAANECKLPAIAESANPVAVAIMEIGNLQLGNVDPIEQMMYAEAAWEHILHDKEAYQSFKELNP